MIEFCKKCSLYKRKLSNYVPGACPTQPTTLMIVGEAPGVNEVQRGLPFCGEAGEETDNYLSKINIPRHRWYITNIVKCRPPKNRDPSQFEIDCCSQNLRDEIHTHNPQIIATMGRFAARYFLGDDIDMKMVHGIPYYWRDTGIIIIPCYHPSYGLHETSRMSVIMEDFQIIPGVLRGGISIRKLSDDAGKDHIYELITDKHTLQKTLRDVRDIAIDTETYSDVSPFCLTFSRQFGEAFMIKSDNHECLSILPEFVTRPYVRTILHNVLFDLNILSEMGIYPRNVLDTMVMAYLLQSYPQGLKPLAHRLLSVKMQAYKDVIREAQIQKALNYLLLISSQQWLDPEPFFTWEKGTPKVKKPQNIGKKVTRILNDYAKDSSLDLVARWKNIDFESGRGEVESQLGKIPIADLSDIPEEVTIAYACRDASVTMGIFPILYHKIIDSNLQEAFHRDMKIIPMVNDMQKYGIKINPGHFEHLSEYFQSKMDTIQSGIENIYKESIGKEINVNLQSPPQVSEMLYDMRIFKFKKQSTAVEVLDKIRTQYPIINEISKYRGISKLKGTYSDKIVNMADENNRVHSTFKTTRVVTGRLSASKPNLMNQPIKSEDGRKIRQGFIAEKGCVLLSGDYSQIEMRMAAHCSQDQTMIKMFLEDKDIHSETASWIFNIPITKLDKDKHRYPAKRIGFGILYGLSGMGLQRQLLSEGIVYSIDECESMIHSWGVMYLGIIAYMEEVKAQARRFGCVSDMFGRRRLVPEAMSVHPNIVSAGLRQAINAPIQMGAQGVIKEAMGQLTPVYKDFEDEGWICRPLIQIHDDILFEVSIEIVDIVALIFKDIMESAVPLSVPVLVDQKIGENWKDMEEIKEWVE